MSNKFFYVFSPIGYKCICYQDRYFYYITKFMFTEGVSTSLGSTNPMSYHNKSEIREINNVNKFLKHVYITEVAK